MSTASESAAADRSRYGSGAGKTRGISGKVIAIFAVALVAVTLIMAGQAFFRSQSRPITAQFMTQERIDDSTTRLWIEVDRKDTSKDAYCIIYAVDYDVSEVGRREVVIPAGGEKLQRFGVEVPTRAPAVSGRIYGCSQDIPPYLDTSSTHLAAR